MALVETDGVDLELRDDQSMTPLMWAAMLGFRVIVQALLQVCTLHYLGIILLTYYFEIPSW